MTEDFDPELDLRFERTVPVRRELVWRAWTDPAELKKWFTPKPWQTIACEIDLRPGGQFSTTMRSPEGEDLPPGNGCYLVVEKPRLLVWTAALGPGYRPVRDGFMTAFLEFDEAPGGATDYRALVKHATPEQRGEHEKMGFESGWGKALDQLVELAKTWK